MADRVRLYGKTTNQWKQYVERNGKEIETISQTEEFYKEYYVDDCSLIGIGAEDFSLERYRKEILERCVWTWDGKKRNKGGKRWFQREGIIRFRKSEKKLMEEYLKNKYPEAELIQLRKE